MNQIHVKQPTQMICKTCSPMAHNIRGGDRIICKSCDESLKTLYKILNMIR